MTLDAHVPTSHAASSWTVRIHILDVQVTADSLLEAAKFALDDAIDPDLRADWTLEVTALGTLLPPNPPFHGTPKSPAGFHPAQAYFQHKDGAIFTFLVEIVAQVTATSPEGAANAAETLFRGGQDIPLAF